MAMRQQQDRRAVLKALDDSRWKTRISEPRQNSFSRWRGDEAARARERAQAVPASRHRPKSLIAEAQTHRRRHAAGGRGRRIWLYLRAHDTHWHRSGRSDRPHRLGGWLNRLRRLMFCRWVKPSHRRLFNGLLRVGGNWRRTQKQGLYGLDLLVTHVIARPPQYPLN